MRGNRFLTWHFFGPFPEGWLDALEFVCFFKGYFVLPKCRRCGFPACSGGARLRPNVTFMQHLSEISRLKGQKAHSSIAVGEKLYIDFTSKVGSHLCQFHRHGE